MRAGEYAVGRKIGLERLKTIIPRTITTRKYF
jgi:hypothetical protein